MEIEGLPDDIENGQNLASEIDNVTEYNSKNAEETIPLGTFGTLAESTENAPIEGLALSLAKPLALSSLALFKVCPRSNYERIFSLWTHNLIFLILTPDFLPLVTTLRGMTTHRLIEASSP